MGLLIIIATTVVIVTVFNRWGVQENRLGTQSVEKSVAPFQSEIMLPSEAKIVSREIGEGKMILGLDLSAGKQGFLIIDITTGKKIGLIEFRR